LVEIIKTRHDPVSVFLKVARTSVVLLGYLGPVGVITGSCSKYFSQLCLNVSMLFVFVIIDAHSSKLRNGIAGDG
jgi:hypothetical protein